MCGILGVVGPDSGAFAVNDALGAISHRGPNDSGLEHFEGAVLGNTRLSILDLTSAGHQPMTLPDAGLCLVHNGEVYNYLELKRKFQGVPFRSCTDTEVILHAFAREGVECLHSLNGMFSFAVWDDRRKRLFAARDRLGIKPFYYAMHNGHLMFSSEVKALLALGHPRTPNDQVIWDYLVEGCYDHLDETFFKGIKKLPAGHYLEYDQAGGLSINRYWHLPEKVSPIRPEDSESEFCNRLEQIVEWECRSDVPVGILFSGGHGLFCAFRLDE